MKGLSSITKKGRLKALVWFWLIDETLSANLVYQDDYEIGSTTPSDEAMAKIMTETTPISTKGNPQSQSVIRPL